MLDRRRFLAGAGGSAALVSLGATSPALLQRAAWAAERTNSAGRVLVVVQLSGGNDGLNTVIPCKREEYYKLRPKLAVPESRTHRINDEQGFHPALDSFRRLLEAGRLAVTQGVGYDRPNRSHFESMDIWHTCRRKDEPRPDGWLGRFLDASRGAGAGKDVPAIHLGAEKQPFALSAQQVPVPSVQSLEAFQLRGKKEVTQAVEQLSLTTRKQAGDLLGFVQSNGASAISVSQRIKQAASDYQAQVQYPSSALGEKLKNVAGMIVAGLSTQIYYVELTGFDTHSQQDGAHTALLRQWGDAVEAFNNDMQQQGQLDRVLVLSFSEFGRRVAENASEGTDHGAAAPVFWVGGGVQPGMHGVQPSLTDLQDGDLKHQVDFRQVYATVLERWFGTPSRELLGGAFDPLPAVKA